MVEQYDTEEFASLQDFSSLPTASNFDATSNIPPVLTKTWFHTGAYFEERHLSRIFEKEYYREPELSDEESHAMLLDDTVLPVSIRLANEHRILHKLSSDENREAARSLKG